MTPQTAYIALGSNLGDRRSLIAKAIRDLSAVGEIVAASPLIETAPEGGRPGQGPYLNGALALRTALPPGELLKVLGAIEKAHGRVRGRGPRFGPRTLDLDLLLYGDGGEVVIDEPDLVVPHPRMHLRRFVLEPLARIAPTIVHPRLGLTIECLRDRVVMGVSR